MSPLPRLLSRAPAVLLALVLVASSAEAARQPKRVKSAAGVVSAWSASQHLYVKGDVGISAAQLAELEVWLTDNAPHWTVVLLESASGERFVDAEGTAFRDLDAALHALGKGLSNRTGFGAQKHPKTGEADGTVFLLSLVDRNLSYFASDAQDRRSLGDALWKGTLDAPAIDAMRNGGRVIDAVKGTVSSIDARLATAIDAELAERDRLIAALSARLEALREELPRLAEERSTLFGSSPPPGFQHRVAFDFPGTEKRVGLTLASLAPPEKADLARATAAHEAFRAGVEALRGAMKEYRAATGRLASLEASLEPLAAHPLAAFAEAEHVELNAAVEASRVAVREMAQDSLVVLATAEAARARVEGLLDVATREQRRLEALPGLLDALASGPHAEVLQAQLAEARLALRKAREAFDARSREHGVLLRASEASYQAAVAVAEAAEQSRRRRNAGGATGGTGVLVAGLIARRRRNASRRKATDLHARWRTAIDEKTQALFALLERTHLVVGRSREDIEKHFTGITRERGLALASDVDELFLLATAAARVLHRAEELLGGTGLVNALGAHLGTARYEQVTRLLRDEPIVFHPDEGVEDVLRGPRTDAQRLIGDLKSYQPFSLSFEALLEAFNTRAERSLTGVDSLEKAPTVSAEAVATQEAFVERLRATGPGVEVLRVRAVIAHVVPSLESLLKQARPLLVADPLAALEGPLLEGARRMADAQSLLTVLESGTKDVLPAVEQAGTALSETGLSRLWLDEALSALGQRAEQTAKSLVARPVVEEVSALGQSFSELDARATQTKAMVAFTAQVRASLDRVERETTSARETLGAAMGKPASALLREKGANPTERHASGEASLSVARDALGDGELSRARESLDAAQARVGEVEALIADSREAWTRFVPRREAAREEAKRLETRATAGQALLEELLRRYKPSALLLRPEDPVHPEANGTVGDNLKEVTRHQGDVAKGLAEAELAFAEARLRATAVLLGQVEAKHGLIQSRLDEVEEKSRRLQATEADNARVLLLGQGLATACVADASDARSMRHTVTAGGAAQQLLVAARSAMELRPADPFAAAAQLAAACLSLEQVRQAAASDRARHAQAEGSLVSAREALAAADRWIRQAAQDGIADSRATTIAVNSLLALRRELEVAHGAFSQPHGDWQHFDTAADRIASDAARRTADLRGELRAAEQAAEAISSAARIVQRAATWHGSAGGSELSAARSALDRGLYAEAERLAEAAEREAREAIEAAEREAEREEARRRAEERERERAREESSRSSSSSSDSGFSSSSYSSGSSGSGSGFGSSSW